MMAPAAYLVGSVVGLTVAAYRGWFTYAAWEQRFLARWSPLKPRSYIGEFYIVVVLRAVVVVAAWPAVLVVLGGVLYVNRIAALGAAARERRTLIEKEAQESVAEIDRIIRAEKL